MTAEAGSLPAVSVIVPVRAGGDHIVRCLHALRASLTRPCEIIVVADGANPDDQAIAQEAGARVICTETAAGPARARNLGARVARGEILLFVDADVLVRPDTIGRLSAALHADEDLVAAFGSYDDTPIE